MVVGSIIVLIGWLMLCPGRCIKRTQRSAAKVAALIDFRPDVVATAPAEGMLANSSNCNTVIDCSRIDAMCLQDIYLDISRDTLICLQVDRYVKINLVQVALRW